MATPDTQALTQPAAGEETAAAAAGPVPLSASFPLPRRSLNQVVESCPPSGIRRYFDIATRMQGVISLGVGEPDFMTPAAIREAGIHSLQEGPTSYTANGGLPELREAVCRDLERRYGACYDPESECLITVGVSEGLDLALRVILNPGDEVIVPEPCYVSYIPGVLFAGGKPVTVPTRAADQFRLDSQEVERAVTPKTKAILLGSPSNPTGAAQTREDLEQLAFLADRHDLYLVSDEIYARLTYEGAHTCLGSLPAARQRSVVLNGFSKSYAMTGWRVGYACAPARVAALMTRVHQYTMLCAPRVSQTAAIEALKGSDHAVEAMVQEYDRRRRMFVKALNDLGLPCVMPQGAFYAFPFVGHLGLSSEQFAERILQEQRVAVAPGSAFGPTGEGYIRCSYATSYELLQEAVERIARFVKSIRRGSFAVEAR